ncbi:MAG TPA: MFS transporter [Candidatus Hydrogenedentes bacterium]|nr:MFS transporter [Candidatus Hydrogenedentota bacterium]
MMNTENRDSVRRAAWQFVLMMGGVSLFADVTYEGARGMLGPWLGALGASAVAISTVSGLAECLGLVLRVVSGKVADRLSAKWPVVFAGYGLNLGAVPLIGLALNWPMAAVCVFLERLGKAVRAPARDALLAHAGSVLGTGKSFAVHEALDQVGAVAGPLLAGFMLAGLGGYRGAFLALAIPAAICLLLLARARRQFPFPDRFETRATVTTDRDAETLPWHSMAWWGLLAGSAAIGMGMADYPLIAYHLHAVAGTGPAMVSAAYAGAMAMDAVVALLLGILFDRWGMWVNGPAFLITALAGPLVFVGTGAYPWLGLAIWGLGMGAQESTLRATVAGLVPQACRATAYGVFYAVFGGAWLIGSVAMGWLYERSLTWTAEWSGCWIAVGGVLLLVSAFAAGQRGDRVAA